MQLWTAVFDTASLVSLVFTWLGCFSVVLVPAIFAAIRTTTRAERAALFAAIATAPAFCPSRGILSTLVTGLAVVVSVRIVDLETQRPKASGAPELLAWLTLPVFRQWPKAASLRADERRKAPRSLALGLIILTGWAPIEFWLRGANHAAFPWLCRSALLVLWFVLTITALAHLLTALVQLAGARAEPVFDAPLLATSPREFWSRRWNRFIARFALRHVASLGPLRGHPTAIVLGVFLASGLFHEYFAWGASGAETVPGAMLAFFLVQGGVVALVPTLTSSARGGDDPRRHQALRPLRNAATAAWMVLTAPWFFTSLGPPILEFGMSVAPPAAPFPRALTHHRTTSP